ncbi:MAG: hypothetical protein ACP5T0_06275 [Verrucomicrobiia bacterium]
MSRKNTKDGISQSQYRTKLAIGAACFVFVAIVAALVFIRTNVLYEKPLNHERSQERLKARAEVEQTSAAIIDSYSWQDKSRGVVRLPVERAMELASKIYQNPQTARSNIIQRLEWSTRPTQQRMPASK